MKYFLSLATLFFAITSIAFADFSKFVNPVTYGGISSVPDFFLALVDLIFLIAVPLIVIAIIYSGFLFVTAGDNDSKIGRARTVFVWTLVGALILLGAKAIAMAIQNTILSL